MNGIRRALLTGAAKAGVFAAAFSAGVLKPLGAWAQEWNRNAFESKSLAAALEHIGAGGAVESKDLLIKAPEIAENGVMVPIEIVSNIPDTVSIAVLADENPFPLTSSFEFSNGAVAEISVRVKLSKTSNVKAVARTADGKCYVAQKAVKVTVGGCGG